TFLFSAGFSLFATAKDENKKQLIPTHSSVQPQGTLLNINNLSMWVYSDGTSGISPTGGDAGTFYPRGTANVVFQDGIIWGGIVRDGTEQAIRVNGQTYSSGTVPGRVMSKGVAEDFNDPNVNRIWRIRRDYSYADLSREAAELSLRPVEEVTQEEIEAVRARYEQDWLEWPWEKGAPFYDADGDGVYTPQFYSDGPPMLFPEADEPGIANADQVVWFVFNDLDSTTTLNFSGSRPIGLETQVTLWEYRRADALGNVIFKQIRMTYKGTENTQETARIDSMYLAQFSETDLGDYGDDFVGCDTLLNIGYTYNYSTQDREFEKFNLPPPAVGYDFLAGPVVPDALSQAIINLKKRAGFRNLPMTTFAGEGAGDIISYPGQGQDYDWTLQWWNLLRGFRPYPANPPEPWRNPVTGEVTKFRFPGDPVTRTGWLDDNPGDRRVFMASGPLNITLGDTNEVTIGFVGGLGSDRLMSITVMKYYDRVAQEAFDNLFELPKPPPTPSLSASEFDGQTLLSWSESQEDVEFVEQWQELGHRFEGYNLYQLPTANASVADGIKLATFDLKNEVTSILQEQFDPQSGAIIIVPVQTGTNSGIVRSMLIETDELRNQPLINGQQYHFAVTSYSFNPGPNATLKSLESAPAMVSATPHSLNPGVRFGAAIGDTLPVVHIQGVSDAKVYPIVVDPAHLTGDEYRVTFNKNSEGEIVWNLRNVTRNEILLSEMTNLSGEGDYLITEGMQVVVLGRSDRISIKFEGKPWIDGTVSLWEEFWGTSPRVEEYVDVHMKWFAKESFTDLNGNGKYDIGEPYQLPEGDGHQKAFHYKTWGVGNYLGFFDVPFAVFDVESDPPRQLNVLVRDRDGNLQWDLDKVYDPQDPDYVDTNNGDFRFNYVFIMDTDYDATGTLYDPNQGGIDVFADIFNGEQPIQWVGWWQQKDNREPLGVAFTLDLFVFDVVTQDDEFTFTSIAPSFDPELARQDVLQTVNVFPNPYYGLFRLDRSPANRFVTFSHLPQKAVVRIFTIAGVLVRTLEKDDASQFLRWDLLNEHGRLVGAGIYIAHIDMPELGVTKILKLAVFHE
ncbi:MAG: hypothetical protein ACE5NG_03245, partial [bacterium]